MTPPAAMRRLSGALRWTPSLCGKVRYTASPPENLFWIVDVKKIVDALHRHCPTASIQTLRTLAAMQAGGDVYTTRELQERLNEPAHSSVQRFLDELQKAKLVRPKNIKHIRVYGTCGAAAKAEAHVPEKLMRYLNQHARTASIQLVRILVALFREKDLSLGDLAHRLDGPSRSNVSFNLGRLEQMGLTRSHKDGQTRVCALTAKGQNMLKTA